LFRISRFLLAIALTIFVAGATSNAQTLTLDEAGAARSAFAAAERGEWPRAYAEAAAIKDPLPLKILHWMDYSRSGGPATFAEITRFILDNPLWPGQGALRRHAEEAARGAPDAAVAAWFERHPPISGIGKVRRAEIMLNAGDVAGGTAALRAAWINGDFGAADEKSFLLRHGAAIRPEDDVKRLDRLLWDGRNEAARRMLPVVPPGWRALAEARLALAASAKDAATLIARVPADLQSNPGLLYEELRWRCRAEMTDAAVGILLRQPDNLVRPAAWWGQRQIVARQLLAQGNPKLAYRIVAQHGLIEGNAYADAEFLLGYVALRFMHDPALAFDHFSRILERVATPYAKARAGYWSGRAAEAEGKTDLARKWFAAGAEHMATFYGQLAAHQLGNDAPPHPSPEPVPDAATLAWFDHQELVRATQLFFALGDTLDAKHFLMRLADRATTGVQFGMLATLAERHGRPDLSIAIAKRAVRAGLPLMMHGYPVTALPPGGTAEHALLYAIIRQESGFDPDAVSPAGARGLMQLMPATANGVAKKLDVSYSPQRLTDGSYNVLLGRAYLQRLIEEFGGSYALAIAAYNGGPGRVQQWLHEFGDPRGGAIDMVDWIEMIPVGETRNYVQRVLENLQIYRGQTGRESAFSLVSDLSR
jgi:peptidoglycan lytic transglycosylase